MKHFLVNIQNAKKIIVNTINDKRSMVTVNGHSLLFICSAEDEPMAWDDGPIGKTLDFATADKTYNDGKPFAVDIRITQDTLVKIKDLKDSTAKILSHDAFDVEDFSHGLNNLQ